MTSERLHELEHFAATFRVEDYDDYALVRAVLLECLAAIRELQPIADMPGLPSEADPL